MALFSLGKRRRREGPLAQGAQLANSV